MSKLKVQPLIKLVPSIKKNSSYTYELKPKNQQKNNPNIK